MTLLLHGRSRRIRASLPGPLRHLALGSATCLKELPFFLKEAPDGAFEIGSRELALAAQRRPEVTGWARRIPRYIFIDLFWTLHKARLDWRRTRHPAYAYFSVRKTAKAIDAFELLRKRRWYALSLGLKKLN